MPILFIDDTPWSSYSLHNLGIQLFMIIIFVSLDLWTWNRPGVTKYHQPTSSTCRVDTQEPRNNIWIMVKPWINTILVFTAHVTQFFLYQMMVTKPKSIQPILRTERVIHQNDYAVAMVTVLYVYKALKMVLLCMKHNRKVSTVCEYFTHSTEAISRMWAVFPHS